MKRIRSLNMVLAAAAVSGVLFAGNAFGTPAQSPESQKPAAAETKQAPASQLAPQTTCPVMGGAINKSVFVDVNGKRIYGCCPACLDAIKKNPDSCIRKLAAMGQGVETLGKDKTALKKDAVAGDLSQKKCAMMHDSCKKKCPMMHDSCKKKCAMMNDSCIKKCPMMNDSSKVRGCYTCSMHPEVMQKSAGKCPKCSMDLVFQTCRMDAKGKGGCCKMKQQK